MKRHVIVVLIVLTGIFWLTSCRTSKNAKTSGVVDYGSPKKEQVLLDENTFLVTEYSEDKTYGYTIENPVMVGKDGGGPLNERRFLNALMGPNGEPITYKRLGSCCPFKTKNGLFEDSGLLDKYEVMHKGLESPVIIYINMYDSDALKIPVGFKQKDRI